VPRWPHEEKGCNTNPDKRDKPDKPTHVHLNECA
jgi:hypothetical protein